MPLHTFHHPAYHPKSFPLVIAKAPNSRGILQGQQKTAWLLWTKSLQDTRGDAPSIPKVCCMPISFLPLYHLLIYYDVTWHNSTQPSFATLYHEPQLSIWMKRHFSILFHMGHNTTTIGRQSKMHVANKAWLEVPPSSQLPLQEAKGKIKQFL